VVARDSTIKTVADLKGKSMSFPAPTAFAATLLPKYFLHSHGLNVNKDIKPLYVGSMESSLMNVIRVMSLRTAYPPDMAGLHKKSATSSTELKLLWETEPMPDNSLMARDEYYQGHGRACGAGIVQHA